MATKRGCLLVIVGARREPMLLGRAALVAKALDLSVFVYAPIAKPLLPRGLLADTKLFAEGRARTTKIHQLEVDNALSVLQTHGIQAEGVAEWQSSIVDSVLRTVADKAPNVVMVAHHRHTGIAEHTLTDDDLNLVRLCPRPLWLVRGRAWPEQASIVGAIDPLHQGDKDVLVDDLILTTTAHIAKALHATAHALHAIPDALSIATALNDALMPEQMNSLEQRIERHHASEVYRLTEAHGFDKTRVHLHTQADVVAALAEIAKPMQVGLIVLGALSRNPLKHMLLGGTADRALRKLQVDILVVKPPPREG